jgi:1-acyl-sn-glycerol-3-phosphate acyltransferase
VTRQALKFAATLGAMLGFAAAALALRLFARDLWRLRRASARLATVMAGFVCRLLGVRVEVEGALPRRRGTLVVGNHMSYLDVVVLSSVMPACFVTSMEVRATPGLGLLCRLGGCLFVERRSRAAARGDAAQLSAALSRGLDVALFPEATSTPGELKAFRAGLFQAAAALQAPVSPAALRYERIDGRPFGPENRDLVCWYGDMDFVPHLWALCGLSRVDCRLTFLRARSGDDARALAEGCHADVAEELARGALPVPA